MATAPSFVVTVILVLSLVVPTETSAWAPACKNEIADGMRRVVSKQGRVNARIAELLEAALVCSTARVK